MYYQYHQAQIDIEHGSFPHETYTRCLNANGKDGFRLIDTQHITTNPEKDYLILTFEKAAETHPDITPPLRPQTKGPL